MLAVVAAVVAVLGFGVCGVLLGVRLTLADAGRYGDLVKQLDLFESRLANLRGEWSATQEALDAQLETLETRRRRTAASLSKMEAKEREAPPSEEEEVVPTDRASQIAWGRRRQRELRGAR